MLRYFTALLLFISIHSAAQPLLLVDRSLRAPLCYANAINIGTFSKPVFPLYRSDVPAILQAVGNLRKDVAQNKYDVGGADTVTLGHSTLLVQTRQEGNKQIYNISLRTKADGFCTYFTLVDGYFDRLAQQKLVAFQDYLEPSLTNTATALAANRQ